MTAAPSRDRDSIATGILCRIGMGLSFSTMGALLKLASSHGMNAPELVFYRSLFSLPVVLVWVMAHESLAALRPNNPRAHLWRSGLGLVSMGLTFEALIRLPLGDATAINFTAPIFATILSFLVLKEPVGRHRWAAVLAGFAGVLIIARPGQSDLPLLGVAIALLAALGQAGVTTTLRRLQGSETMVSIVFWFAIAGIVAGGLMMPVFGRAHALDVLAIAAAAGLAGGLGQLLMTASLRAPVSAVTPFDYLQIVAATLYGWLLFADVPTGATIGGGALIAASGLYTAWREHRLRLRRAGAAVPAV